MAVDLFVCTRQERFTLVELTLPDMLDSAEFDRLNERLLTTVSAEPGHRWVIDLSRTAYVGSAVLGLLVNIWQRIRTANGRLVLCGLSPALAEVFHATSLVRLFTIARTKEDATRLAGK